jgi:hypothetical protein
MSRLARGTERNTREVAAKIRLRPLAATKRLNPSEIPVP